MAKLLPSSSTSTPSRFASSADPPPPWTPPDRPTLGLHCVDGRWSSRCLTAGTNAAARWAASPEPALRAAQAAAVLVAHLSAQLGPQHLLDPGQGTSAASSCRRLSSLMNSGGRRSRRVDSTCPNLAKVTPPSSIARRTERASLARPSDVDSSDRRPPRTYGIRPRRTKIPLICQ